MRYIILGHENPDVDCFVSGYLLEKVMKKRGYDVSFCVPDKELSLESEKICTKYKLNPRKYMVDRLEENAKYILIDHHDREVPGEIVAILDHHPTPKDKSMIPYYKNEKISATALLIAKECEDELSKKDIELACLATFIDTVSFHSTKTVKADISWINEMTTRYELDYDEMYRDGLCLTELTNVEEITFNGLKKADYDGFIIHSSYIQIVDLEKNEMTTRYELDYDEMYRDGLCLTELTNVEEITFNGLKKADYDGFIIHSSYIQIVDLEKNEKTIEKILNRLKKYVKKNKVDLFVFIVYDMTNFYTKVYKVNETIEQDEYFLYASRGNTIIPDIVKKYCSK